MSIVWSSCKSRPIKFLSMLFHLVSCFLSSHPDERSRDWSQKAINCGLHSSPLLYDKLWHGPCHSCRSRAAHCAPGSLPCSSLGTKTRLLCREDAHTTSNLGLLEKQVKNLFFLLLSDFHYLLKVISSKFLMWSQHSSICYKTISWEQWKTNVPGPADGSSG